MRRVLALVVLVCCAACGAQTGDERASDDPTSPSVSPTPAPSEPPPVLMPDLVGLFDAEVGERMSEVYEELDLLGGSWMPQKVTDCDVVPRTIVRQEPPPGTPLRKRKGYEVWLAELDLERFRGPCEPAAGELGPVRGADARLAREFYRFAAAPSLGAPFVDGDVWLGVEGGPPEARLSAAERGNIAAWTFHAEYADRLGDMSPLDTLARSGGYYEVHRGVVPTCASGWNEIPDELAHLRAITLTTASDTITACMDWWGVVLYLDEGRIAGVALKLGAP